MTHVVKTIYEGEVLDGQDFSRRCLLGVRFVRCSLRLCSFEAADISYGVFEECDLYECSFRGAVLYVTKFIQCDATKAQFQSALLGGFRMRDTDVTHLEFGAYLAVGKNRKRYNSAKEPEGFLICPFAQPIPPAQSLEKCYKGIWCPDTHIAVAFIDEGPADRWHVHRRRSEIAKVLERVLSENGYRDRSLEMYYTMRSQLTRATPDSLERALKIVFLEWLWGYGVKPSRPIVSSVIIALLFACAYATLPYIWPSSGIGTSAGPTLIYQDGRVSLGAASDILVFALQVATISVYGDTNPIGLGKWLAVAQTICSVIMIGLLIAAVTRRIGNV